MSELRADLELAVPKGKTFTNLQEVPDVADFGDARGRGSNDAFEGSIPGGRILKSKSASRSNLSSVKKPSQVVSGTRYPSASQNSTQNRMQAGSYTRSNSVFWAQTARIFLFLAFLVMGVTLIALAIQVVKSNAQKHQSADYMTSPPILEEQQQQTAQPETETNAAPEAPQSNVAPQVVPGLAAPEPTDTPMK